MPIQSPFHECTSKLNHAMSWRDWGGFFAAERFDSTHDPEYHAFRQSAGLMDYTPLFKYEVTGKDAASFLARVMVKDISKLKVGRVTYCCWCDDDGNVIDDGTVTRQGEEHYRVTAAEPSLYWFERYTRGYDVKIHDSTEELGALSLQGPRSRDILVACCPNGGVDKLNFFRMIEIKLAGCDVSISRTGYTGDLGYEIWCENADGVKVWEEIMAKGEIHRIKPCGLDALDVTRIEAGFIMIGVDYYSANHVMIDAQKSTPYELGLGWCVNLDREPFNGQAALKKEKAKGSKWATIGVVYDWDELERNYLEEGLTPEICSHAWRDPIPLYDMSENQVGYATSGTWSPIMKKNVAICTVKKSHSKIGTKLKIEHTVMFKRKRVTVDVVKTPFFNPERKRK